MSLEGLFLCHYHASTARPMDRRRRYVFDLSVCLCVRTCMPGRDILQPACRRLYLSFLVVPLVL